MNAYCNLDAERAVLAAGMKRGGNWKKLQALTPEDFYDAAHRRIFRAEQALLSAGKPAAMATMPAALAKYGDADADMQVLVEIVRNSFGAEFGIDENARIIRDLHLRRSLYSELENAMDALGDAANETEAILEDEAWNAAKFYDSRTRTKRSAINAYGVFLKDYPEGAHAAEARARIDELSNGGELK